MYSEPSGGPPRWRGGRREAWVGRDCAYSAEARCGRTPPSRAASLAGAGNTQKQKSTADKAKRRAAAVDGVPTDKPSALTGNDGGACSQKRPAKQIVDACGRRAGSRRGSGTWTCWPVARARLERGKWEAAAQLTAAANVQWRHAATVTQGLRRVVVVVADRSAGSGPALGAHADLQRKGARAAVGGVRRQGPFSTPNLELEFTGTLRCCGRPGWHGLAATHSARHVHPAINLPQWLLGGARQANKRQLAM